MKQKIILFTYLFFLLIAALIPLNNAGTALNENHVFTLRWDYLLHVIVYAPLPVLLGKQYTKLWFPILLAFILSAGLEFIQVFLPYRGFNFYDMAANGAGVGIGYIIIAISKKYNPII